MAGRVYSIEYKTQAVKQVTEDCLPAAQASRELGINVNTLREWVRRYREDNTEPFVGSGNQRSEPKIIRELEKRIKDLEEENAILKKAEIIQGFVCLISRGPIKSLFLLNYDRFFKIHS